MSYLSEEEELAPESLSFRSAFAADFHGTCTASVIRRGHDVMGMGARRKAVLIVEDEPLVLMLAVAVVEEAGFEALAAANADEALDALVAEHEDIGIVFTDIHMPGSMNGLQLAFAIRKRWPPIEILIASGRDRPSKADLPPRSQFLAKPYKLDHLREALCRMAA